MIGHILDRLAELRDESVHCVVTSPPYFGLRDYGIEQQVWPDGWRGSLGLESTPALYIEHMVAVFREVRRVLRKDGTLWLNIGDCYAANGGQGTGGNFARERRAYMQRNHRPPTPANIKPKDLLGIPWMLAFALRDDGWWLRSEITWAKRAPMPESVTDRPTSATEKVFLLTKSARYFYDAEAVKEESVYDGSQESERDFGGKGVDSRPDRKPFRAVTQKRNMRNWWLLGPEPFPEAHFATFPTEIPRRAILAGCPVGGTVLDPFLGAGTTAMVADQLGRDCIGIELNQKYAEMAERRIRDDVGMFADIKLQPEET